MSTDRTAQRLAVLLAVSGITHFAVPRPYDAIVPGSLPGTPRLWTYVSGAAELATAAALASPRTPQMGWPRGSRAVRGGLPRERQDGA